MKRLLNNLPIRVFFGEGDGDGGGGGSSKGEAGVPQWRVNEITSQHKTELAQRDTKIKELESQLGGLATKDKELETAKTRITELEAVERDWHADLTKRWTDTQEALTKSHPDQLKKMQEMSAFKNGGTPADAKSNLTLYTDLMKAEFFGDKKVDTDQGRPGGGIRKPGDSGYHNPAARLGSNLKRT